MSNIISSLGGGSGIDVTNLISGLVEAERAPAENRLDTRQAVLDAQISGYGALKSALSDLRSLVSTLSNNDSFNARSVAFPDNSYITANSIAPGAQTGTYQIEVVDVARAQTLNLETAADRNAMLGFAGTLKLEFGTWTYDSPNVPAVDGFALNADLDAIDIEIEASDSLTAIAQKINDTESGVQASVLKVDDQFQLIVTSAPGADNALRLSGVTELTFAGAIDQVQQTQAATDAIVEVNGLEVRRQSNELDDVIEGFNFTLNRDSEGTTINFTVEADKSIVEQGVRDFVEGYNLFYTTAKALTGFSRDEENQLVRGDLATDSTAKTLLTQIRNSLGDIVPGADVDFAALSAIGIKTNLDGSISLNETTFQSALSNNFTKLEALFAPQTSSQSSRVEVGQGSRIDRTLAGNYRVDVTQDATKGSLTADPYTLSFAPDWTVSEDIRFTIAVGGTSTAELTLTGTFSSENEVAEALQALINNDSGLSERGYAVDVTLSGGQFVFENRAYGSTSTVEIVSASTDANTVLGINASLVGTDGVNAAGTIDGVDAFGAGQVLLPDIDSNAYGLTFTALEGAAAEDPFDVFFARGIGGELNRLIDEFLSSTGPIASREDRIEEQLDDISDDREALDKRIESYEARLLAQYTAMEQIISSLNTTSDSLVGLADRLPFTASRN